MRLNKRIIRRGILIKKIRDLLTCPQPSYIRDEFGRVTGITLSKLHFDMLRDYLTR